MECCVRLRSWWRRSSRLQGCGRATLTGAVCSWAMKTPGEGPVEATAPCSKPEQTYQNCELHTASRAVHRPLFFAHSARLLFSFSCFCSSRLQPGPESWGYNGTSAMCEDLLSALSAQESLLWASSLFTVWGGTSRLTVLRSSNVFVEIKLCSADDALCRTPSLHIFVLQFTLWFRGFLWKYQCLFVPLLSLLSASVLLFYKAGASLSICEALLTFLPCTVCELQNKPHICKKAVTDWRSLHYSVDVLLMLCGHMDQPQPRNSSAQLTITPHTTDSLSLWVTSTLYTLLSTTLQHWEVFTILFHQTFDHLELLHITNSCRGVYSKVGRYR